MAEVNRRRGIPHINNIPIHLQEDGARTRFPIPIPIPIPTLHTLHPRPTHTNLQQGCPTTSTCRWADLGRLPITISNTNTNTNTKVLLDLPYLNTTPIPRLISAEVEVEAEVERSSLTPGRCWADPHLKPSRRKAEAGGRAQRPM